MWRDLYWTLLVIAVCIRGRCVAEVNYVGMQPSLMTQGGHLVLVAGSDKNISLETRGSGFVNINGQNIVQIAKMAVNASETVERLRLTKLVALEQTVHLLSQAMEGPRGMKRRMSNMEAALNNGTAIPTGGGGGGGRRRANALMLVPLTRRLTALENVVKELKTLLTNNECSSNPCKNGGSCEDSYNGFFCRCPSNWEGVLCERDVNECAHFAGTDLGCQNKATCVNKPGTYECMCPAGWFGVHCTQRSNDCSSASSRDLCDRGICVSQSGAVGYTCICDQGWTTNSVTKACSTDVDECAAKKHPCSGNPFVRCNNIPGSFYCDACPIGYSGNGFYCNDVDECATNNGGCSPLVQCTNTQGSRVCGSCPPGYVGDGVTCSRSSGPCATNNGGCSPYATCNDNTAISSTYVQCTCLPGYVGSGVGVDGCTGGGAVVPVNACASSPCRRGSCITAGTGYRCNCPAGYTGQQCERLIDGCREVPCLNGGTCVTLPNGLYRCKCAAGWQGASCYDKQDACGGVRIGDSGTIKFPSDSTQTYGHNISCAWMIKVNETKVLNITFKKFDLERSHDCSFDYMQIHDGRSSSDQLIGRYCGNTLPKNGNILTTSNAVYMWFRSDADRSHYGFELDWNSTDPVCGGKINTTGYGTLTSPGSPGKYPPNRDCYWHISAPLSKRIQFQFFTLMIAPSNNCTGDYLAVHDGLLRTDPVIAKYCTTIHPPPLVTPGAYALVHFHSDAQGSDTGFQLTYSIIEGFPGCGGVLTAPQGDIVSPRDPDTQKYKNALDCGWRIQQPENQRITISFISFELETSRTCSFDYLEIREGADESAPLVNRYCGKTLPLAYSSTGNVLFVRFRTDYSLAHSGFHIKYKSICGGDFSAPEGILTSPNYPDPYPDSRTCIYRIIQPTGKAIKLHFLDFEVEDNSYPKCNFDYLQIRDGDDENSTLVGQYCGGQDKTPPDAMSTHNYMWLQFNTDSFIRNRGFKANYSTIDTVCGGIVRDLHGVISSPRHPETYQHNLRCTWVIVAPPGYVIQLTFITFSLEYHPSCRRDYVEVFDNSSLANTGGLVGRFCASNKPPILTSSENMMTMFFVTDSSVSREGFTATYIMMEAGKLCGGNFYTTKGTLQSPNYPNDYLHEKDCTWVINVPQGQQIMLNVTDFKMENHSMCNFDYLEIRNGGFKTSPLVGKFCGSSIPKMIPSLGNQMFLRFVSDSSRSAKGFKIIWDGTATGCGGTLTAPSGSITSPNYPSPYGRNAECYWRISVSQGSSIQLVIVDLELETHSKCKMDYIEIHEGRDMTGKLLGRYCSSHPTTIASKSNNLYIKFRSDVSQEGRGFHLKYDTLCTTTITGYRGVIESPNFPASYPGNIECTWHIQAPPGNKVNITFSHFDTEVQPELTAAKQMANSGQNVDPCEYDYVTVTDSDKDTQKPTDHVLGKFCGNTLPPIIWSSESHVFVHFRSDALVAGIGFRLEWVLNGCGGLLDANKNGTIMSPGYPVTYKTSLTCEWIITTDFDKSIQLNITDLNVERSIENCQFDSVQVYSGEDATGTLLGQYCHSVSKPSVVTTTGNKMFVRFVSDFSYSGRGFNSTYSTVPSVCGGLMTMATGTIHSRNYPQNYDANDECQWLIVVDESHLISLNFLDFDVEYHNNCTMDYVRVYDGDNQNAPRLMNHCGNDLPNPSEYFSTTNKMLVHFKSDGTVAAKGFKANYTLACGARIVTEDTGVLSLIGAINLVKGNCSWVIVGKKPEDRVTLTITHIDVSRADEAAEGTCDLYYVEALDGESLDSPRIGGQYCGNRAPPHITSSGNAMVVHLVSPNARHYGEFSATYSVLSSACGGALSSEHGSFATPNYPSKYPLNAECVWQLNASPGNRVQLSFSSFDIATSESCNEDYVEVREEGPLGKMVGVYCGDTPSNLTAANKLWVKFRSGSEGEGAGGFIAEYTLLHGNQELTGTSGKIASPLYPRPYVQEGMFEWRITVKFGYAIAITFSEFYVDSRMPSCPAHLSIHDGFDKSAPELMKVCGGQLPDPVTSSSNVIFIQLTNDPMRQGTVFVLDWLQVSKTATNKLNGKNATCGRMIDMRHKDTPPKRYNLTSPGYPGGYGGRLDCEWIFVTTPGFHLSLFPLDVDLETNAACSYDNVQIYRGRRNMPEWRPVKTICLTNTTRTAIHVYSSLMRVIFHTDAYVNKTGFSAVVNSVCGGLLTAPNGVINVDNSTRDSMPRWPTRGLYGITSDCQWNITVRPGRKIGLKFTRMGLPNATADKGCGNEYVMLKNGGSSDSPVLGDGKYCGNTLPGELETSGNRANIRYKSEFLDKNGFRLEYREIGNNCGGEVILSTEQNSTNISSPNYPNIPSPHTECSWVIMAPAGEKLKMTFIERFDLTKSLDCTNAAVEVRDGGTQSSVLIGKYCLTTPSTLETTGNIIYVRFFTDVEDPKNGFKATISLSRCGGLIRGLEGVLTSPGSPGPYPQGMDCEWRIVTFKGRSLSVELQTLDLLRSGNNCTDYVMLSEPDTSANATGENVLGTYCNGAPKTVRASSNELIVRFHSTPNEKSTTLTSLASLRRGANNGFKLAFNSSWNSCSTELSTPSGTITTLNYPASLPERYCEWSIRVPKGRRVTLTFTDFDIPGPTGNGVGASVYVYSDLKDISLIGTFNSSRPPTVVKSTSNEMRVDLRYVRGSAGHRGFKATYTSDEPQVCGGRFENITGGVIVPPDPAMKTFSCEWESVRPPTANETMTITVVSATFGKLHVSSCYYSSKLVVYQDDVTKPLVSLCTNITEPYIIRSPYPVNKLWSVAGAYQSPVTFLIRYSISSCGKLLNENDDVITSPGYPGNYPNSMDCAWAATATLDTAFWYRVNFTLMDIESSPDCTKDYLIIRNGPLPTSPHIGRYCGNTLPSDIQTQNSKIWVDFHSDESTQGKGFKFNLIPVTSGCGGIYHKNTGTVNTPKFPQQYPSNTECEWEFRVGAGYTVVLTFVERFFLEDSTNCVNDYAEISEYDATSDTWKVLGKVCGRKTPPTFKSSHGRMKLLFRSNAASNGDGFKARWNIECGGVIEGLSKGQIISPNFPANYDHKLICNYTVVAPNQHISLVFDKFNLEQGPKECGFDNLTIYGLSNSWTKTTSELGKYCGTTPPPNRMYKDVVSLILKTDDSITRPGFLARFEVTSCGGDITQPGPLLSPNDNAGFLGNLNCTWTITAPANQVVILRFSRLELEHSYKCMHDSVKVYEGVAIDSNASLASFCGNLTEEAPLVKSKGSQMTVVLSVHHQRPQYVMQGTAGFTYGEKAGCGGSVNVTRTPSTIVSPDVDRDGKYESFLDCHWLLTAPVGNTVSLDLKRLDLAPCYRAANHTTANCSCDFIEVRDGNSQVSDLIARYCDVKPAVPIISSSNSMWVRLVTDDVDNAAGFSAGVVAMPSICGPMMLNVTNTSQTLQSPNYPSPYPNNIRCRWLLTAVGNFRFDIHIDEVDLEDSVNCASDSLTLNDIGVRTMFGAERRRPPFGGRRFPVISEGTGRGLVQYGRPGRLITVYRGSRYPTAPHKFCGKQSSFNYYSESNNLEVLFATDSINKAKGFKLSYQITGCTRNYTGVQGRIFVERLPDHCYITVVGPENTTISLYFNSFQLFSVNECKNKALDIRDGANENAPELARYCGHDTPKPVFSTGNKLYLHSWRQDGSEYENFDITYTTTDKGRGCGGQLFNYGGIFTSPLYPNNYRNFSVCRWDVSVPTGTVPLLKFHVFDIGSKATCDTDFVELIDIDPENGADIVQRKYCGNDVPALFTGMSGTVAVRSTTSVHNGGTGWVIKFMGLVPGTTVNNF